MPGTTDGSNPDEPESPFPVLEHKYLTPPEEDPIQQAMRDQLGDLAEQHKRKLEAEAQHLMERTQRLDEHEVPNEKRPY